jgi:hypothetical protein
MRRCEFPQLRWVSGDGGQTDQAWQLDRPCPKWGGQTDMARQSDRPFPVFLVVLVVSVILVMV